MRTGKRDCRKIEEAFVLIHGRRKAPEPSPSFDADVMRQVRKIRATGTADQNSSVTWAPLVWRLAASTCLVAFLLVVYTFIWDYGTEHEMTMAFLNDAADFIVVQSFGIL